jgi:hypothetical protein
VSRYQSTPKTIREIPETSRLLAPDLLKAARSAYGIYLRAHAEQMPRPAGVVVSQGSTRGQLIFVVPPILLPGERFVSFEEIESQMY